MYRIPNAQVMYAAAWLVGEFSDLLDEESHATVMTALLHANVAALPEQVQSVYLQSALKIYVTASGDPAKRGLGGKSLKPAASVGGGGGGGSVDLLGSESSSVAGSVTSSAVDLLSQAETSVPATNGDKMQELVAFASSASAPAVATPAAPGSISGSAMTGLFGATAAAGTVGGEEDMDSLFGASIPPAAAAAPATENGAAAPAVAAVGSGAASGGGAVVKGGLGIHSQKSSVLMCSLTTY